MLKGALHIHSYKSLGLSEGVTACICYSGEQIGGNHPHVSSVYLLQKSSWRVAWMRFMMTKGTKKIKFRELFFRNLMLFTWQCMYCINHVNWMKYFSDYIVFPKGFWCCLYLFQLVCYMIYTTRNWSLCVCVWYI